MSVDKELEKIIKAIQKDGGFMDDSDITKAISQIKSIVSPEVTGEIGFEGIVCGRCKKKLATVPLQFGAFQITPCECWDRYSTDT